MSYALLSRVANHMFMKTLDFQPRWSAGPPKVAQKSTLPVVKVYETDYREEGIGVIYALCAHEKHPLSSSPYVQFTLDPRTQEATAVGGLNAVGDVIAGGIFGVDPNDERTIAEELFSDFLKRLRDVYTQEAATQLVEHILEVMEIKFTAAATGYANSASPNLPSSP